jgi:hypothetical protein
VGWLHLAEFGGLSVAIAGKLLPQGLVHLAEIGRPSGRHREQAHSYRKAKAKANRIRFSPLNRMSVSSAAAFDLDLEARRQAEWRD